MGIGEAGEVLLFENRGAESWFGEDHHPGGGLQEVGAGAGADDEEEGVMHLAMQPECARHAAEHLCRAAVTGNGVRRSRARPLLWGEFDGTGTDDPTPWLCAPLSIREIGGSRAGGWPEVMAECRAKAIAAEGALCDVLGIEHPAPDAMIGALASVPLPPSEGPPPSSSWDVDPLWARLESVHRIQVPLFAWPAPPARMLRVACPIYVSDDDVARLFVALREERAPPPR